MYELSGWGEPVENPDWGTRERVSASLPAGMVRILRSRARAQGVSVNALLDRLLHEALALPGDPYGDRGGVVSLVDGERLG